MKMKQFAIQPDKWLSVGKGALIVVAAALLTYAGEHLSEWMIGVDFGKATPMIVASLAVLINYARQVITNVEPDNHFGN
jgi:hypothetical protein